MKLEKFVEEVFNFFMVRRRETGGFAATPLSPPTIEDTFFTLETIEVLKELSKTSISYDPSEDEALKNWLKHVLMDFALYKRSPKILWYLLKLYKTVFKDDPLRMEVEYLRLFSKKVNFYGVERVYYLIKIIKFLNLDIGPLQINLDFNTVRDLYILLWIYKNNFIPSLGVDIDRILTWLNRCYNPDGGFGFLPGTTSYIENTYFALRCYNLLEINPPKLLSIKEFVFSCYEGKGGFSRKPGGTVFLESSYYGVRCIKLLLDLSLRVFD